jgi:AraC family transcriptional regulator
MSEQLKAIHASIEYIEDRLKENITVADIAAAAGYSLYHFIRTFNHVVHHTPYDYLIRRRLSEAALELLADDPRIIDIALDYQFNNHETFSRAFKRMFDLQPSQWRERSEIPYRSLLPRLTSSYLEQINQGAFLKPVLVERKKTFLIGLVTTGRDDTPELWLTLKQALQEMLLQEEQKFYRVISHSKIRADLSFNFLGVETTSSEPPQPPFVIQALPAGSYTRFLYKGKSDSLHLALDYIYTTWLPKSGCRLADSIEVEFYGNEIPQEEELGIERYIYLPLELDSGESQPTSGSGNKS